jgi:hypothetical protein
VDRASGAARPRELSAAQRGADLALPGAPHQGGLALDTGRITRSGALFDLREATTDDGGLMPRDYRPWTEADVATVRQMSSEGKTAAAIAAVLHRTIGGVQNKITAMRCGPFVQLRDGPPPEPAPAPVDEDTQERSEFAETPLSVEDVINLWQIDTAVWEPVAVQPNSWQVGARHPETGEILARTLYQTKVRFRRIASAGLVELTERLVADIAAETGKRPRIRHTPMARPDADPCALELDVFDLHIGKYAWGEETGTDYDSDIAEAVATAAVSDLLAQAAAYNITEVVLPLGNDFFHYDNPQGQTTAGTPMDRDTRFQRMFRTGRAVASWMIERCAEIAPVRVIVVPGNHDTTTAFTLGVVMEAEFRHDPRVTIDNSPRKRKYYRFGKTLLGFAHGHEEKPSDYPQLMAVEQPDDWAASTCRGFQLGHIHTGRKREPMTVDDKTGVTVRWLRSLSGTDGWHHGRGYVGGTRAAEAFVWRYAGGQRAHFVSRPVEELLSTDTTQEEAA